mmetsp:Transcript_14896/g.35132  ORF Transcript_14896/g.35132 Transcript_14896/m.35132 type:complete len:227 (+) Transcript_14896:120-800(+)
MAMGGQMAAALTAAPTTTTTVAGSLSWVVLVPELQGTNSSSSSSSSGRLFKRQPGSLHSGRPHQKRLHQIKLLARAWWHLLALEPRLVGFRRTRQQLLHCWGCLGTLSPRLQHSQAKGQLVVSQGSVVSIPSGAMGQHHPSRQCLAVFRWTRWTSMRTRVSVLGFRRLASQWADWLVLEVVRWGPSVVLLGRVPARTRVDQRPRSFPSKHGLLRKVRSSHLKVAGS